MPLDLKNLNDVVRYHAPDNDQITKISNIRIAAEEMLREIMTNCPPCADTTAACRKVREAMMTANAAIVLKGMV